MAARTHDGADAELWQRSTTTGPSSELTPADVAAVGRAAWTWRSVDDELAELLRRRC